jgi:hypothetical protein
VTGRTILSRAVTHVRDMAQGHRQRIEWVPGRLPGVTQTYFEIGHPPAAPSYRLTVWDYTFIESRRAEAP